MAPRPRVRTLLGTWSDLGTWQRVYETPDALEVDESNGFTGIRRRVFYDEVLLVTRHRATGWAMAAAAATVATMTTLVALWMSLAAQPGFAAGVFAFAVLLLGYVAARLAIRMECITVHGRRSRARVSFWLRKGRADRAFERVCARVRHAQERAEARTDRPGAAEVA